MALSPFCPPRLSNLPFRQAVAILIVGLLIVATPGSSQSTPRTSGAGQMSAQARNATGLIARVEKLEAKKLLVAMKDDEVNTKNVEPQWALVPDMELQFSTAEGQTAHALFTAPGTEMFTGNVAGQNPRGICYFRITIDGRPVSKAAYAFRDVTEGFSWRNALLQWAGELDAGQHTVRVEWCIEKTLPGKLTTGIGGSTRCLTIRLD